MAKKENRVFTAALTLGEGKGAGWLAYIVINKDDGSSTAKRWIKERVQALTPRKSVKMIPGSKLDEKGKPVSFTGTVEYKVDASL